MNHRFVNQLADAEEVDEIYRAAEKQLRPNRNGNLYLQVQLSDRSGFVTAMMWNANDKIYKSFENGDFVHIAGTAQVYNGTIQIIASNIKRVNPDDVDESDFVPLDQSEMDQLSNRLREILRDIGDYHLRNLAECFLVDDPLMDKFQRAPAGIKIHHAYRGGLLEHVVNLMELSRLIGPRFPKMNTDLLVMGAFVHDIGKVEELIYDRDLAYSDEGQLIGHASIGVRILEEKIRQTEELSGESFPFEIVLRLKHMIISHHGKYEFGSAKLPMTIEAVALHYLDSLDSTIHSFQRLIGDDLNTDSRWTTYQAPLGRKIFKGGQ